MLAVDQRPGIVVRNAERWDVPAIARVRLASWRDAYTGLIPDRELHRRLNILVYLNEEWHEEWGGQADLWDESVSESTVSLVPSGNRCLVFNTTESSYHGVTPVRCPAGVSRNSFAAYYYTKEPPPHWDGTRHSTVFRSRPDERWRERVLVPLERLARSLDRGARSAARAVRGRLRGW